MSLKPEQDEPFQILTINSGSSSVKFAVFSMNSSAVLVLSGQMERIGAGGGRFRIRQGNGTILVDRSIDFPDHDHAFLKLFEWLRSSTEADRFDAVGHRIVHGGIDNVQPRIVTPDLVSQLRQLVPLAPEHLPHEIKAIEAVGCQYPELRQAACFDTSFHRRMLPQAQTFALPRQLQSEGVQRYGFHGLSYEYIMTALRRESPLAANGRVIIAHLGNGASMAAVTKGIGIDTTMGFTPAGGLVMSTRSGDLDPGALVYLIEKKGLNAASLNELINRRSGLLGISGVSSEMKDLLESEEKNPRAKEAIEIFCYQAKKFIGSLCAVLGGLDTLVFTGGIGEHSPSIRKRICDEMSFIGIELDPIRNDENSPIISKEGTPVSVRVMNTNEELMIARHTAHLFCST